MNTKAIVTEDFTKGSFNSDSSQYWQINGTGTDFRVPNNRNFDYALANRIATGGGSFSDSVAFSIPDAETIHPSGLQQFKVKKDDEVAIVRYTTFSDIAKNFREQYHLQVALLQSDPNLNGAPNFGHDLSLETESRFVSYSASNSNRLQLTANVENVENINSAQRNAYYGNTMTAADLDREYSNLVIWRDLPGNGVTNIEQWASNAVGDYNVNAEMASQYEPNIDLENALFNEVRVFLQRGGTNVDLIRDNVDINDAQIGLTKLHVGITKKTDFNLDYRTDAQDFILWYGFYNSSEATPTMLTGDADNDKAIALDDFELWKLNRGEIHDSSFAQSQSVYTNDSATAINSNYVIPTANNTSPVFVYDPVTGELKLNTQGESLVAWIIRGQTANSIESLGDSWWTEAVGNTQQWVDLDLTGFSSNELVTVANLEPNLDIADFPPIQVSFADDGTKEVNLTLADVNNEPETDTELDTTQLIAELLFEENNGIVAVDSSPFGLDNSGRLNNGAYLESVGGDFATVANFEGNNDYIAIANSTDINLGIHSQRTISVWFQAEDINSQRQQVLYEEGGTIRGLNIYLDQGQLYVGGWNIKESGWSDTYLDSNDIASDRWHHVALVLDGKSTVEPDSLIAYLDGKEFARGAASQLWSHGDGISLGNINGSTKFHTGNAKGLDSGFSGNIDQLQIFNRALDGSEISNLFASFTDILI